jgi:hypothetical protein
MAASISSPGAVVRLVPSLRWNKIGKEEKALAFLEHLDYIEALSQDFF